MTTPLDEASKAKTQDLIDALEESGYEWSEYSGRGMNGAQCVGVELEGARDLFILGQDLVETLGIGAPMIDDMGRKIIAYWPARKLIHLASSAP